MESFPILILIFMALLTPFFNNLVLIWKQDAPSFRQKPESSSLGQVQLIWTPVFTGVTPSHEAVFP